MEERELILKCKEKNVSAFEDLILKYEGKIYNLCFYILKNREDALDAAQETSIKIYKSINKFKGNSKVSTWIYRVTYNTCMDYLKKRKDYTLSFEDGVNLEECVDSKIEGIIEERELKYILKECILRLNSDFRMIILLRDINGLSYQDISDILNIELGTVKSRVNRAREALKKELIKSGIKRGEIK